MCDSYARGANLRAARAAYVTRVMVVAVVTPGASSGIALAHAARRMPQGSSIRQLILHQDDTR